MKIEELKSKYAAHALERSGAWLLDNEFALRFIDELAKHRLKLNGIEGYWLRGDVLEPSLENSVYFIGTDLRASKLMGQDVFAKARNFIGQRKDTGLLFDIDFEA